MQAFKNFISSIYTTEKKITTGDLDRYNILQVPRKEFQMLPDKIICQTLTGTFYEGVHLADNKEITIKIIDLKKVDRDIILNELALLKNSSMNKYFLYLYYGCLEESTLYLAFEKIKITLDNYIVKNDNFNFQERMNFILSAGQLLEKIQLQNKINGCIEPKTFSIIYNKQEEKNEVKMLEFGYMLNFPKLKKEDLNLKYSSPELLNTTSFTFSSDTWSFGLFCLDLLTIDGEKIMEMDWELEQIKELIQAKIFPKNRIHPEVKGFVKDLITRCFHLEPHMRIRMEEFNLNLKMFYDSFFASSWKLSLQLNSSKNTSNSNLFGDITNSNSLKLNRTNLNYNLSYVKNLENVLLLNKKRRRSSLNNDFSSIPEDNEPFDEFLEGVNKNNAESLTIFETSFDKIFELILLPHINALRKARKHTEETLSAAQNNLKLNYEYAKDNLENLYNHHKRLIDRFYEKVDRNLETSESLENSYRTDLTKIKSILKEVKSEIICYQAIQMNKEKYRYVQENIAKNIHILIDYFEKYKNELEVKHLKNEIDSGKYIIDIFQTFSSNKEVMLNDLYLEIKRHLKIFEENICLRQITEQVKLDSDISVNKIGYLFAKAQENSNILTIYNLDKKKFHQKVLEGEMMNNFMFKPKCTSIYLISNNTVYISGGCNSLKQAVNDLYSFKLEFLNFEEYKLFYQKLSPMINERYSHAMINHQNLIFNISGWNNYTCEVYDINREVSKSLPDLTEYIPNASLCIMNSEFLLVCGSDPEKEKKNFIFKIDMKLCEQLFNYYINNVEELKWEVLEVKFDFYGGRFKRGMCGVENVIEKTEQGGNCQNSLLLLGGFDFNYSYDHIYQITFDKDYMRALVSEYDIQLPMKGYFTTNYISTKNYAVMIDGHNNSFEFNLKSKEINIFS
jgi:hypothetical protein